MGVAPGPDAHWPGHAALSQDWGRQKRTISRRSLLHKLWVATPEPLPRKAASPRWGSDSCHCGAGEAVGVGNMGRGRGIRVELRPCFGFEMPKLLI